MFTTSNFHTQHVSLQLHMALATEVRLIHWRIRTGSEHLRYAILLLIFKSSLTVLS
jgi:hypothetical protein